MRVRTVVAVLSLLLPAASGAQRVPQPRIGGRHPAEPVPLPPTPAPIARQLAYTRMNVSIESYPMISYVQAPGFTGDGVHSAWTTLGAGARAEYRLTRHMSATLDLTSSLLGGPAIIQTAELGTRFHPEHGEGRWHPFADVRGGYTSSYDRGLGSSIDDPFGNPSPRGVNGPHYSRGFGAVAGVGTLYDLTNTFSLTTGVSVIRSDMSTHDFQNVQPGPASFRMTAYRYTIGIRYNPIRLLRSAAPAL